VTPVFAMEACSPRSALNVFFEGPASAALIDLGRIPIKASIVRDIGAGTKNRSAKSQSFSKRATMSCHVADF
jgi:hypothetical protein